MGILSRTISIAGKLLREGCTAEMRAALARSTFPPALFRANRLKIMRLVAAKRLARPLPDVHVRWACEDDLLRLASAFPRHHRLEQSLADGSWLLVGYVAGEPAAMGWFDVKTEHVSLANAYSFEMGENSAWAFGLDVLPKYRMSGVFHKYWSEAVELLHARGIERIYGSFQIDTRRSVNSHRRVGFVPLFDLEVQRIAGTIRHRVTTLWPESSAPDEERTVSGFGRWRGRDPLIADILSSPASTRGNEVAQEKKDLSAGTA